MGDDLQRFFRLDTPIGEQYHVNHGDACLDHGASSADRRSRLYVRRVPHGFLFFCHNCGWRGCHRISSFSEDGVRHAVQSALKARSFRSWSDTSRDVQTVRLPNDFQTELPRHGTKFLLKYLDSQSILRARIGWSDYYQRIVVPVFGVDNALGDGGVSEGRDLVAWQGRRLTRLENVEPTHYVPPKWITVQKKPKEAGYFYGPGTVACVVEDTISAIKLSTVCTGVCLLGSSYLPVNITGFTRLFVWLDYDKKQEAAAFARRYSTLYDIPAKAIFTREDPKAYTVEQIKEVLGV